MSSGTGYNNPKMNENFRVEQGTLYVVATPIGNLEDITLRAIRVLQEVALIAAEDTRHTTKLLQAYGIKTPLTSLFEWNERTKSDLILAKLHQGESVAYVSDAGTPGVSDPGYVLIRKAIEAEIRVVAIPGASALLTALSVSGLPMDSFVFYAFLPHSEGKKKNVLAALKAEKRTMIFYDSPKRLLETLRIIRDTFGEQRRVVIARELTKRYEEIIRESVGRAIDVLTDREIKGEITLLIEGSQGERVLHEDQIRQFYDELSRDPSLSTKDIIQLLSERTGLPKKVIYKEVLDIQSKREEDEP